MNRLHQNPQQIAVIAGPCSISGSHCPEVYNKQVEFFKSHLGKLTGVRMVGYKSRTCPDSENILMTLYHLDNHALLHLSEVDAELDKKAKDYYGLDICEIIVSQRMILDGVPVGSSELPDLPSVLQAKAFQEQDPQLMIATEIIEPIIQIPQLRKHLSPGSVLAWTPSNDALGPTKSFYRHLPHEENFLAIKNPKWIGLHPDLVTEQNVMSLPGIKAMLGCMEWANTNILIHRGFELEDKEGHRAKPVHSIFTYLKTLRPDLNVIFDPSHSLGPKKRDAIVEESLSAIVDHGYHGLLIEASVATTDSDQHISAKELTMLLQELRSNGYEVKRALS